MNFSILFLVGEVERSIELDVGIYIICLLGLNIDFQMSSAHSFLFGIRKFNTFICQMNCSCFWFLSHQLNNNWYIHIDMSSPSNSCCGLSLQWFNIYILCSYSTITTPSLIVKIKSSWAYREEDWVGRDRLRRGVPQSAGNAPPARRFMCRCHQELRWRRSTTRKPGDANVGISFTCPDRKKHAPAGRRPPLRMLFVSADEPAWKTMNLIAGWSM